MNLKEALERDKLKQFIKEREKEPVADKTRFDAALELMLKTPPATQATYVLNKHHPLEIVL